MTVRSRRARTALLLLLVAVVPSAGAVVWSTIGRRATAEMPVYGTVPDFSLTERSGRTITRTDLIGKVSVVNFFYTRCTDTCPLQSAHLARLQADLGAAPDLLLISITVDPDHDDRDVLTSYAGRFRADSGHWLFLTGPRPDIYRLAVSGFHLAAIAARAPLPGRAATWMGPTVAWAHGDATNPRIIRLVHASRFALVDRQARIRGYFNGPDWDDIQRLHSVLRRLLRER